MTNWKPIDTAPKDGTTVYLWADRPGRWPEVCSWWSRERIAADTGWALDDCNSGWFREKDETDEYPSPTHWKPYDLPPPPKEGE